MDVFQNGLLGTIETCGKTLLETFDNLLAFAKVNNLMTSSKARKSSLLSSAKPPLSDIGLNPTNVDLGLLAEEVLETAYAGYEFVQIYPKECDIDPYSLHRTDSAGGLRRNSTGRGVERPKVVSLILDYDNPTSPLWTFETEAGGWKRAIINLVGNSLKYTDEGSITVHLDATPVFDSTGKSQVTVTVSDTGRGMSDEFQQGQLFAPFVQEDPLVPGTGLGLSIVKQIVTGMGGTVSVKSKKDCGTEIQICIPVAPSSNVEPRASSPSYDMSFFKNLRILMLDIGRCAGDPSLGSTFAKQCGKWYGLNPRASANLEDADIYVISDGRTDAFIEHLRSTASTEANPLEGKVLVIMCRHLSSTQLRKEIETHVPKACRIEYLCQPFGPKKMARLLSQCLDFLEGRRPPSSTSSAGLSAVDGQRRDSSMHPSAWIQSRDKPSRRSSNPHNLMIPSTIEDVEASELPPAINASSEVPEDALASSIDEDTISPRRFASNMKPGAGSSPSVQQTSLSGLSILLVDDNKINLQLLETFMKKHKHRYDTAMNGVEALQTYKTAHTHTHGDSPTSKQPGRACTYDYIVS